MENKRSQSPEFNERFDAFSLGEKEAYRHAKLAFISACIGCDVEGYYEALHRGEASEYFKKMASALTEESISLPDDMIEVVRLEIMNASEEEARQYESLR